MQMPLSEAVGTPLNYFHAYMMAAASSPSIVTAMLCTKGRTTVV